MVTFSASLCNQPIPGGALRGQLDFARKAMHFHRPWWQAFEVDIVINYRDIVEVNPCTHFLIVPAVEIRLVCGTTYKFLSVFECDYIVDALRYMMQ